jgi:glutathione synthase
VHLAFIIDPIHLLDPGHDTSVALMEAAQLAGHEVWITQVDRLSVRNGQAWAWMQPVTLSPVSLVEGRWQIPQPWYQLGPLAQQPLETMQAVFMRKDPPVDTPYLYATYILDAIDAHKTLLVNSPAGIRAANEKMYALQFPDVMPITQVSSSKIDILKFVEEQGQAVMKPLGGKAGEGILFLEKGDRNLNSMIEISTFQGRIPVMVQEYLPAAKQGDKRVILLDGEPIGAVNRVPSGDEFRGNMAVGGQAVQAEVTDRDREIAARLAPVLHRDGLFFVGIDIIGGYLTEVNVTSPTGLREIDRLSGVRSAQQTIEWVAQNLP